MLSSAGEAMASMLFLSAIPRTRRTWLCVGTSPTRHAAYSSGKTALHSSAMALGGGEKGNTVERARPTLSVKKRSPGFVRRSTRNMPDQTEEGSDGALRAGRGEVLARGRAWRVIGTHRGWGTLLVESPPQIRVFRRCDQGRNLHAKVVQVQILLRAANIPLEPAVPFIGRKK